MKLLDAVNLILPKLGERPVTSTESRNPTLAVILPQINAEVKLILHAGWWFNTAYNVDLFPNSEGDLEVPEDCLSFVPNKGQDDVVARGERFYNQRTRSYKFTEKVTGTLRSYVPFEELPESAADFAVYSACVTIYATDIGLEQVVTLWRQYAQQAQASMEQEHLRHRKFSVKRSPAFRRLRNAMRG